MKLRALATLLVLAGAPCAAQRADSAVVARQLDSVYARMTLAYQRTDARMVTTLYDDRAFYLPPGAPILRGRDAISRQFTRILGARPADSASGPGITFEIVDRAIAGDIAFDIGLFRFGSPAPAGKFIVLWRRGTDGKWRIWADQYNDYRAAEAVAATRPPAPVSASPGSAKLGDFAGSYRAVYPSAFENNEIRVQLDAGRLTMHGMSGEPAVLQPGKADEFSVVDPNGPEGLIMRFHRNGERIVGASLGTNNPSRPGPAFFFLRQ